MSNQDSHLRSLLSPSRSGTFFAPFRSRSANPDGFDSKMRLWLNAIEEWAVSNQKLTLSIKDIHQIFVSDSGVRPDKECIRLVLSEMKRRSRAIPINSLRSSRLWTASSYSQPLIDTYIDPKGWFGWGVKKFVYEPATWAAAAFSTAEDQSYSDLTDMSITDSMKFVCQKSLHELSQHLYDELLRISKAEKQHCFEWHHLLELVMPIINTIIDAPDGKELLETLDILMEYLELGRKVAMQVDNETKLVKIISVEDISKPEDMIINKKDIATARLLRAKELLTADADKYHARAQRAKQDALESFNRKEVAKAKSLLRSHKRLMNCAEQKEGQLTNVEILLDQLENTNSNMMILEAYKDGAEALKIANTQLDANTTILDDMYDAAAESRYLNDEMTQMLNDISRVGIKDVSTSDLEAELNQFLAEDSEKTSTQLPQKHESTLAVDDLQEQLSRLDVVPNHQIETSPEEQEAPTRQKLKTALT